MRLGPSERVLLHRGDIITVGCNGPELRVCGEGDQAGAGANLGDSAADASASTVLDSLQRQMAKYKNLCFGQSRKFKADVDKLKRRCV